MSYHTDTTALPEGDGRAVELIQSAMERLGFEITTIRREAGSAAHWQVHWRVKSKDTTATYGARAETAAFQMWHLHHPDRHACRIAP